MSYLLTKILKHLIIESIIITEKVNKREVKDFGGISIMYQYYMIEQRTRTNIEHVIL